MNGPRDTGWFKSSFSNTSNDNCVEVRFTQGNPVAIRDSKNPTATLSIPTLRPLLSSLTR
ncbi:DUF397 domain-containing protein [Actinokineospora globicatena]|uniref:DUF397 domain-containing protein n=1 Tax=Actinokineospora globicatena TaxID=103729 RepID=UPI0020A3ECBC|nr:DUF397 domain-containing protein [Actinokineospora globicatena]MCP2300494.1 protein of unknown function (DUF397) [Actinokineospora globicatena]GLW81032.1 hypothetical protein Aglo01_55130 [Actinokineospora globicatena]GLW88225.1 hypothetical protein Aglo02_58640 [Actinokineospora globicatena]